MKAFLRQEVEEGCSYEEAFNKLKNLLKT
ncbi:MAG: hypothetical protein ACK4K4_05325 [Caldimicrobium sp.]